MNIAIDPSLNSTGVAYDSFRYGMVTYAITVKKMRGMERLAYVRDQVAHHLDASGADTVIYENYSFGSKGRSVFDIGELGGVLKTLCYEKGLRIVLVPPATLKLFTAGKGTADKDMMAAAILERWGLDFPTNDEADAFALYQLGEVLFNKRKQRGLSQKVRDSLKKCEALN
jgi:Holliday junction resolvasome RuvABC endonuclease subunit